jgi:DNA-directed RNA polymerase specialized sigma24 family protein
MAFNSPFGNPAEKLRLEQITTVWSMLGDPAQFIMRYAPAIQAYFAAIITNRDDAEEAIQEFLLRVTKSGFTNANSERGRFRDYLKTAVRNAALAQLRKESARTRHRQSLPAPAPASASADDESLEQEWVAEWRKCVLDRSWRALERYEASNAGSAGLPHTTLRLVVEYPDRDSKSLAAQATQLTGQRLNAEGFRQRLSRARRVFARLVVQEVAETLQSPTPDQVEDELVVLGLMGYVRRYLPPDWRAAGVLPALLQAN